MAPRPNSVPRQTRFQMRSSVATKYARRLETSGRLAKEPMSRTARRKRISMRISKGAKEIGHGRGGVWSIGGGLPSMDADENEAMSWDIFSAGGPSREW